MSESYTLTDVIMTQSYGMKNTMPSTANNGQLLIARVNDGISELWGGTGSGVELLSGAKIDLSNLNQNGEAHFASPSLNNLDSIGEAHFQAPLISGTNIKTISSKSLLGSGNIDITSLFPIGIPIVSLDFNNVPTNCIRLEGQTISRTTYAKLFSIYGTTYGAGDGSTTFKLPDCRNRVMWGSTTAGYLSAGLPDITGTFKALTHHTYDTSRGLSGAFSFKQNSSSQQIGDGGTTAYLDIINFKASDSSSIYGNASTVQPPVIKVKVYTRYQ